MNINYNADGHGSSSSRTRLAYGATPLSPWKVTDQRGDDTLPYGRASINRVDELIEANSKLIAPETTPLEVRARLGHQALSSLHAIHTERIGYHSDNPARLKFPDEDVLYAAEQGTATPQEMFQILLHNPHMQSVELAKLSNPFDKLSTDELTMHDAINQIILDASINYDIKIVPDNRRYKVKRTDKDVPSCIVSRKQCVAEIDTEHGAISIVRRQTLQIRGDKTVFTSDTPEWLDRRVRNAETSDVSLTELASWIDDDLEKPIKEQGNWVQPVTTSYYAHYFESTK